MLLKKEYMNIYLVSAILIAAFAFMIVSTWKIFSDVSEQTSADLAIDRQLDACWEKNDIKE
jgi:TRAP-type C4-dicarboxylate transport system permease small subunit